MSREKKSPSSLAPPTYSRIMDTSRFHLSNGVDAAGLSYLQCSGRRQ